MPEPASSAPQHPSQSDGDAGLEWTHDGSQIGADEIPEAFWDKLLDMYPGSKKLIRKIRSLLIDCNSETVNAGTALMIFAALSGVALLEHPAYQELVKLLKLNNKLIEMISEELHKFYVLVKYGYIPDKHQIREIVQEELAAIKVHEGFDSLATKIAVILGKQENAPNQSQDAAQLLSEIKDLKQKFASGYFLRETAAQASALMETTKPCHWWAKPFLSIPLCAWIIGGLLILDILRHA